MSAILISKVLAMVHVRVAEGSHSITCHPLAYPRMEWAILPISLLPSRSASPRFGWYLFPAPQRAGGWV